MLFATQCGRLPWLASFSTHQKHYIIVLLLVFEHTQKSAFPSKFAARSVDSYKIYKDGRTAALPQAPPHSIQLRKKNNKCPPPKCPVRSLPPKGTTWTKNWAALSTRSAGFANNPQPPSRYPALSHLTKMCRRVGCHCPAVTPAP